MKFFFKTLVLVLLFCAKIGGVNSQGILIFEISDVKNRPVSGLSIDVKKDGVLYKNYQTDASGRLVDMSIPEGDYTYSFDYGDLNVGAFTINKSDWVWIDLDYRTVLLRSEMMPIHFLRVRKLLFINYLTMRKKHTLAKSFLISMV